MEPYHFTNELLLYLILKSSEMFISRCMLVGGTKIVNHFMAFDLLPAVVQVLQKLCYKNCSNKDGKCNFYVDMVYPLKILQV